jgi:hypothetical protein
VAGLGRRGGGGSSPGSDPRLDQLERLGQMRDSGVLDASEYQAEKARILSEEPRPA